MSLKSKTFLTFAITIVVYSCLQAQPSVLIPEFQVNGDYGGFAQKSVKSTYTTNGNHMVIWVDNRDDGNDMFARFFDENGLPITGDLQLNSNDYIIQQNTHFLAADNNDRIIVVWEEERWPNNRILANIYNSDGSVFDDEIVLYDSPDVYDFVCGLTIDQNNNIVVATLQDKLYIQKFDITGQPVSQLISVIDDSTFTPYRSDVSVSANTNGRLIVAWAEDRDNEFDVLAQIIDTDNSLLGSNFTLTTDTSDFGMSNPKTAAFPNGNFLVAWGIARFSMENIVTQIITDDGSFIGNNTRLIQQDSLQGPFLSGNIVTTQNNMGVVSWFSYQDSTYNLWAQRVDENGNTVNDNFKVDDVQRRVIFDNSISLTANNDQFNIIWSDNRNGDYDIFKQTFTPDGTAIGNNTLVNSDTESGKSGGAAIAVKPDNSFIISWADGRNEFADVYKKEYDNSGTPIGEEHLVNDDGILDIVNGGSDIALLSNGDYVIVFNDHRDNGPGNYYYKIYYQHFGQDGQPIGSNTQASKDSSASWSCHLPRIAANNDGKFAITWEDNSNFIDVYTQLFENPGQPVGNNIRLSRFLGRDRNPSILMQSNGSYWVTWQSTISFPIINTRKVWNNGTPIDTTFEVNQLSSGSQVTGPVSALDGQNNLIIAWSVQSDVFVQRLDSLGNLIDNPIQVNEDEPSTIFQKDAMVAADSAGNFIVTWTKQYFDTTSEILAQRYHADGTAMGDIFQITESPKNRLYMQDLEIQDNRMFILWRTEHPVSRQSVIMAKVMAFMEPQGTSPDKEYALPRKYALYQNYPNPFNPETTIQFDLPQKSRVSIKIYDVTGRLVKQLVNRDYPAGPHKISWDGKDEASQMVSSGNYFYKINAGTFTESKKMILLK